MAIGKFHGVIRPTTPDRLAGDLDVDARAAPRRACRRPAAGTRRRRTGRSGRRARSRRCPPAASCPPRATAGGRARPCAPGSRRRSRLRMSCRCCGVERDQAGNAALAAAIARSASARVGPRELADHVVGVRRVDVGRRVAAVDPLAGDEVLSRECVMVIYRRPVVLREAASGEVAHQRAGPEGPGLALCRWRIRFTSAPSCGVAIVTTSPVLWVKPCPARRDPRPARTSCRGRARAPSGYWWLRPDHLRRRGRPDRG